MARRGSSVTELQKKRKKLTLKVHNIYNSFSRPIVNLDDGFEKIVLEISSKRMGATVVMAVSYTHLTLPTKA